MSLIDIQWNPADRQVRQFAAICLIALPFVAWWWGANSQTTVAMAGVGLMLTALAWLKPSLVKPLFVVCTLVTAPIGLVIGEVVMLTIFVTVFCPIGLLFRLIGRDVLQRRVDRDSESYWQDKRAPNSVASYYRQS